MNTFIPGFIEVLSTEGWLELEHYHQRNALFVLDDNYKYSYLLPKICSKMNYKGKLLSVSTETCQLFLKPDNKVVCDGHILRADKLTKQDILLRFYSGHKVENIGEGEWEGNLYSLFFGTSIYLPIRFDKDYCLLMI